MHLVTVHAVPAAFVRGAPVFESGESALRGWTGVVVPSLRGPHLVVRWENDSRGMETSLTGGTALDLCDPLGRAAAFAYLRARGATHDVRLRRLEEDGLEQALAWSVLSVSRGGELLEGYIHVQRGFVSGSGFFGTRGYMVAGAPVPTRAGSKKSWGWRFEADEALCTGPEFGDEGRVQATAAALAHRFAVREMDGPLLLPPLPALPELPEVPRG